VPALDQLARTRPLVALTNAGLAQAFAISAASGVRWTFLASGEVIGAYKPDIRAYEFAIERLGIEASRALFVAAHPWDLTAAARHGVRTAYLDRADSPQTDLDAYRANFDIVVPDLTALASLLSSAPESSGLS
jgi:2-haloacid dehalogenase